MDSSFISTADAARLLHVSASRVRQLIAEGHLAARRFYRVWLIDPASLDRARQRPGCGWPRGRPRKSKSA